MRWVKQLRQGDSGNVLVLVAVSIFALAAMAILAIDISKLLVTRAQLQNAADAGALAGAKHFLDPLPDQGVIEARAREVARMNRAYNESRTSPVDNVSVVEAQADMANGIVTVTTHSEVSQYFTPITGLFKGGTATPSTGNVAAIAAAQAGQVYSVNCLKPWSIPDRWDDTGIPGWGGKGAGNGAWDGENFTDQNGNGIWDPGEPFQDGKWGKVNGPMDGQYSSEFYHPILTGYVASKDLGQLMTFKAGSPGAAPAPGQYYCIDLPGSRGGADYRDNIAHCNPEYVKVGDWLWTENGNMVGPTRQGVDDLMSNDPDAYWDDGCKCVKSPIFGENKSPRIVYIPLHDPRIPLDSGKMQIKIAKIIAMFLEGQDKGRAVIGRFMRVQAPGQIGPPGGPGYLFNLSLIR